MGGTYGPIYRLVPHSAEPSSSVQAGLKLKRYGVLGCWPHLKAGIGDKGTLWSQKCRCFGFTV